MPVYVVFAITHWHRFGESGRVCSLQVRTLRSLAIGPDSGPPLSSLRGPCVPPRSERQATPRPAGPGSSMAAAHWRDRSPNAGRSPWARRGGSLRLGSQSAAQAPGGLGALEHSRCARLLLLATSSTSTHYNLNSRIHAGLCAGFCACRSRLVILNCLSNL